MRVPLWGRHFACWQHNRPSPRRRIFFGSPCSASHHLLAPRRRRWLGIAEIRRTAERARSTSPSTVLTPAPRAEPRPRGIDARATSRYGRDVPRFQSHRQPRADTIAALARLFRRLPEPHFRPVAVVGNELHAGGFKECTRPDGRQGLPSRPSLSKRAIVATPPLEFGCRVYLQLF